MKQGGCKAMKSNDIIEFCKNNGIVRMSNKGLGIKELESHLEECDEIYFVATTASMITGHCSQKFLPRLLSEGKDIYFFLPINSPEFCRDVGTVEIIKDSLLIDEAVSSRINRNIERIENEIKHSTFLLEEMLKEAHSYNSPLCGHLYIGSVHTLIRQTVALGLNKMDNKRVWSWMSITMPPNKTIDGTFSLEISDEYKDNNLAQQLYSYVMGIKNYSMVRETLREIK